ncbi:MAG: alpha-hydroxy acid oxidase [Rhodobacteraceae bacterium]|nr:alpha-hydroxy acid oxidase [Paracoccaceae bacterium]MCY4250582.1 alpha-hydroxy acid oxidase [Paracoccaceae bacterium]
MPIITCIEDLRQLYKRRVPKMFYDYVETGSWSESTFKNNTRDLGLIKFNQKVGVDISQTTTEISILGKKVSMPMALAPVGLTGMQSADGEIKAARVARKKGIPFILSTMSVCSIEDVAREAGEGFWFQLYYMNDQEFSHNLIKRAKEANCSALVLTMDLQVLGQRHMDLKNGLAVPPRPTISNLMDLATKVRWGLGILHTPRKSFGNVYGHVDEVEDLSSLMSWVTDQFYSKLDWDTVRQVKDLWNGPLVLKGIMDVDDAIKAASIGVDAIVVSNHGGRQLDGALSTIRSLPAIVEAVGDKVEVYFDSGIRSGQDVLRAIGMGAKATLIGRAYIYGLGAMGEAGVEKAIEIMHKELATSMALCGISDISEYGEKNLLVPSDFQTNWKW